jgi:hypothetical protein
MMKECGFGSQYQGLLSRGRVKWSVHAELLPAGDNGRKDKLLGSTPFSQKKKYYYLTYYLLNSARRFHPPQRIYCEMKGKN